MKPLSLLFSDRPIQWGLRGDPFLWKEMEIKGENVKLPETELELVQLIENLFQELVGQPLLAGQNYFVERYNKGGMSSGRVCSDFWIERGIPFLLENFKKQRG